MAVKRTAGAHMTELHLGWKIVPLTGALKARATRTILDMAVYMINFYCRSYQICMPVGFHPFAVLPPNKSFCRSVDIIDDRFGAYKCLKDIKVF